jgi:ribosomal protein L14
MASQKKKHYHIQASGTDIHVPVATVKDEAAAQSIWFRVIELISILTGHRVKRWDGRIAKFNDNTTTVQWSECDEPCLSERKKRR